MTPPQSFSSPTSEETNKQVLKPLKLIKSENGYKIKQYIKSFKLIPIEEVKLTTIQRLKRKLIGDPNPIYNELTTLQKSVLHTIAPIWANIIQHNIDGSMIVTDDSGNKYDLNSIDARHCLVGEVYSFGNGFWSCKRCYEYNMDFASLNSADRRNEHLGIKHNLKFFLNHYYNNHMLGVKS